MMIFVALALLSPQAEAAAPTCEAPRLRDTTPLAAAAAQDKVLAGAFQNAADTCAERGQACDQARADCGGLLMSVIQKQIGFDEGRWLRDMLLPYLAQQYPPSRTFGPIALAPDASCNVDVERLKAAAQRRRDQAARREVLFQEYALYGKWAEQTFTRCREKLAVDQQQAVVAKTKADEAAAAQATQLAQQKADAEAKAKADEAARLQKVKAEEEARRAAAAQEASAKQAQQLAQQQLSEQARRDELARQERQEAEKRNRAAQLEAEQRGRDWQVQAEQRNRDWQVQAEQRTRAQQQADQRAAEERARAEAENRALVEREQRATTARTTKRRLVDDAEGALKLAQAEENARRQEAADAVNGPPGAAQVAVERVAEAERTRLEAEHTLAEARLKAERIEVDDAYERSRGHVGILGGGGAFAYTPAGGAATTGGGLGVLLTAHFGFWGTAPLQGMGNGFEVALAARFFQTFGINTPPREIEGHISARYFFGPLGVGAVGEGRWLDPSFGVRAFGFGPTLAIAAADTPHVRVVFSFNWLPVGSGVDLLRLTGDAEVSYEWFTFRLTGGPFTQSLANGPVTSWSAAAYAGARFAW